MKNNCLIKTFIVFLYMCLIFFVYASNEERYNKLVNLYNKQIQSAVIDIDGFITDTNDNKLDGVKMSIDFLRPTDVWATNSEILNEYKIINSKFSIQKKNYTAITVTFSKQGYYDQNLTFYCGKKANETGSSIQSNIQIQLREIGKLAKLIKFNENLIYNMNEKTQIICVLSNLTKIQLSSKTVKLNELVQLDKYIYLDFKRDRNDEIIFQKKNTKDAFLLVPEAYVLRFISADKQDGFIILNNQVAIKDITYLTDTPKDNYISKEIIIPYSNLESTDQYFYIKCGNFYGKGKVTKAYASSKKFWINCLLLVNETQNEYNVRSDIIY